MLTDILLSVIPALFCITFHELCHGLVAYKLGDNTAKQAGRLTLNPIKHIDIMGLLMMVVFKFGWAKPVPVNMNNFKNPKSGMAITALAGPVSNLLLSAFLLLIYGFVYVPVETQTTVQAVLLQTLSTTAYLSCALAMFNFLPIPPLDGSKVLMGVLPPEAARSFARIEPFGFFILLALFYTGVIGALILPIIRFSNNLLLG